MYLFVCLSVCSCSLLRSGSWILLSTCLLESLISLFCSSRHTSLFPHDFWLQAMDLGQFTEQSDVWSFAVLLHEMWTRAEQPYGNWYVPPPPPLCLHAFNLPTTMIPPCCPLHSMFRKCIFSFADYDAIRFVHFSVCTLHWFSVAGPLKKYMTEFRMLTACQRPMYVSMRVNAVA